MRRALIATLVMLVFVGTANAGGWSPLKGSTRGTTARTGFVDPRSGGVVSANATLQPVIGSVQRTGHFTNPFTHKSKYTGTVYNPLSGQFSKQAFRR
ncbi:hypothetical protein VT84_00050 [Gemmata sp. SH-PL17]|uniref:hypothetical protein n=1 Tax=Gemmata sp. SH-PL17 TaxID=1630693 RepID=UPI0004AD0A9E|nr:hypothetical protein [Gemmata sp. SH-PL17]AMV22768.1 hypothetical protein VT84_00050 [Gemmata sp. SH-PL17]